MQTQVRVLIGIQARSTSQRFPNKGFELIGSKTLTQHVVDACSDAAQFVSKDTKLGVECAVALLTPEGDPLAAEFSNNMLVVEGPEQDVLKRYELAFIKYRPDYLVRITGDCPLIPPYIISTHIRKSVNGKLDYCSNVFEDWRTDLDGFDCEVISSRAFEYIAQNATAPSDREHVTTLIRKKPPVWARIGSVIGFVDLSGVKLSVDTPDDLERVRKQWASIERKHKLARENNHVVLRL